MVGNDYLSHEERWSLQLTVSKDKVMRNFIAITAFQVYRDQAKFNIVMNMHCSPSLLLGKEILRAVTKMVLMFLSAGLYFRQVHFWTWS